MYNCHKVRWVIELAFQQAQVCWVLTLLEEVMIYFLIGSTVGNNLGILSRLFYFIIS